MVSTVGTSSTFRSLRDQVRSDLAMRVYGTGVFGGHWDTSCFRLREVVAYKTP